MANPLDYLLDRVQQADLEHEPFPHLFIRDFLSDADFKAITTSREVQLPIASDVEELFRLLDRAGYGPIEMAGSTESKAEYLRWLREACPPSDTFPTCEAQGMTFRLHRPNDEAIRSLDEFFRSAAWSELLRERFGITRSTTTVRSELRKYLHGYEISPHPDNRKKAVTWMLNINPAPDSRQLDFHTHYMRFKPEWVFVSEFWHGNPTVETCWVPWDWCSTVSQQADNNSVVIFSPRWDTIHAVRARYDHLMTQRTQMLGNLWYDDNPSPSKGPQFEDFDLVRQVTERRLADRPKGIERVLRKVRTLVQRR